MISPQRIYLASTIDRIGDVTTQTHKYTLSHCSSQHFGLCRLLYAFVFFSQQAIIYVIDASDVARLPTSRTELLTMLSEEELRGVPVLVFANKQVRLFPPFRDHLPNSTVCLGSNRMFLGLFHRAKSRISWGWQEERKRGSGV